MLKGSTDVHGYLQVNSWIFNSYLEENKLLTSGTRYVLLSNFYWIYRKIEIFWNSKFLDTVRMDELLNTIVLVDVYSYLEKTEFLATATSFSVSARSKNKNILEQKFSR